MGNMVEIRTTHLITLAHTDPYVFTLNLENIITQTGSL